MKRRESFEDSENTSEQARTPPGMASKHDYYCKKQWKNITQATSSNDHQQQLASPARRQSEEFYRMIESTRPHAKAG